MANLAEGGRSLRIIFDHQAFSLQVTGGITRYYFELIRRLNLIRDVSTEAQLGFCTTVWPMQDAFRPNGRLLHWGPRLVGSGVGSYLINEALLEAFNVTQAKCDIYHNTLYRFMPGVRARRYVATHHDCTIERFPHLFREASLVMKAKRNMFRKADLVFCVTEASRNDLHEFYDFDRSRTVVVTNGSEPLPRSTNAERKLKERVIRPFVLYVGTRMAYKNFTGFLNAFSALDLQRDYDIVAIGGGAFSEAELGEVKRLGLQSTMVRVPLADAETLGEAYAAASLFVYPSLYEGLGLPPLEAMEKGCPVLASSTPASVEVCKDAALFFNPFDEEDFARKLQLALQDSPERRTRVERGYEVCKLYCWDDVVRKMVEAYRSIL